MIIIDENNKDEFVRTHKSIVLIEYDKVLTNKESNYKRIKPNLGCAEFLYRIKNMGYDVVLVTVRQIDETLFGFLAENEYYHYIDGITNIFIPHVLYMSTRAISVDEDYRKAWASIEKMNGKEIKK